MANWVDQDLNLRLAGQPWTSAKATADAENTVALAEGAPGAPKVVSAALDMLVGAGDTTTDFIDLDRVDKVLITAFAGTDEISGAAIAYALSNDNGANFGTSSTVLNVASAAAVASQTAFAVVELGSANNAIRITVGAPGGAEASFSILGVSGVKP